VVYEQGDKRQQQVPECKAGEAAGCNAASGYVVRIMIEHVFASVMEGANSS
jgi:hypothetical protein